MSEQSSAAKQRDIADRLLGARIVAYGQSVDGTLHLDFEHRGTDDDSGVLIVRTGDVHFNLTPLPPEPESETSPLV